MIVVSDVIIKKGRAKMKHSKAAAVLAGTFIGVAGYSAAVPAQVQKASYKVQITKNAYVYTSKGKKTYGKWSTFSQRRIE